MQGTSWTALRTPLHPSRPAHTLCPQVGQQCMLGGGHTSPWGRGALSPLLAPSMGTGPTGTGGHRHVGRIPPSGGCASLEMVDGRWTPSPLPSPWAGCRLVPSTIPGAVTSGRPQLHPACPTDAPFRSSAARMEPSAEPRPAWRALGRQLPAEPPASSSDQPRRSFTLAEPSGLPEPGGQEGWSSSLPRLGRNVPVVLPRRVSHGGEVGAGTLPTPPSTEGRDVRGAQGCLVPLLACSWEWRAAGSQAHGGC